MSYVNIFYRNSAKGKLHVDWAWSEKLTVDRRILHGLERSGPSVTSKNGC